MAKIFVTRRIPGEALQELTAEHEVVIGGEEGIMRREELQEKVKGVTVLVATVTEKIDAPVLAAAGEELKLVANYAVGYDNVDVAEATKRRVMVTNTPGRLGDAVAEFTLGLVMALARRMVEADKFVREGKYHGWDPNLFLGLDLTGKTLGIIGPGTIGAEVGRRLQSVFEMRVLYYCRHRNEEFERQTGGRLVGLETLLMEADVVSVHVPLTEETRHLISDKELGLVKPTVILINTARGPVVEEKALRQALEQGRIWGAALDVFEEEVAEEQSHLDVADWRRLKGLPNVILTPHIGSATIEARKQMTRTVVKNIKQALAGERPDDLVNDEVWGKKGGEK